MVAHTSDRPVVAFLYPSFGVPDASIPSSEVPATPTSVVAVYARTASMPQYRTRTESCEQLDACYAAALTGDPSAMILAYRDDGISGIHPARPALSRLLDDIAMGRTPIRRVYVSHVHRLSRVPERLDRILIRLAAHNVALHSATEGNVTAASLAARRMLG